VRRSTEAHSFAARAFLQLAADVAGSLPQHEEIENQQSARGSQRAKVIRLNSKRR
jgi:hypothetical protein